MNRRLALIPAACAALALSACSSDDDNPITTEFVTITNEAPAASTTEAEPDDAEAAAVSTDGALAAIQDARTTYPDGIITDLDKEGDSYEIDLISGEDHLELLVDSRGKVTEKDRDSDDDAQDRAEAAAATVSAAEAAQQALLEQPDGVIDSLSLDEEEGSLIWKVELDDAEDNDLGEVTVPAA